MGNFVIVNFYIEQKNSFGAVELWPKEALGRSIFDSEGI